MAKPRERWRPIPGFPLYMVSDMGRVCTYKGKNQNSSARSKPKVMGQRLSKGGYPRVTLLDKNGEKQVVDTHILVARAFLGPSKGLIVRHRDGDSLNPRLSNLMYGTHKQNAADRVVHGTDPSGERNANSLLSEKDAGAIFKMKGKMTQQDIADKFGVARQTVSDIHRGITWSDG